MKRHIVKILGIDPGMGGALAWRSEAGAGTVSIPVLNKRLDIQSLVSWIHEHGPFDVAYVEQVHAMPKQGVVSTFTFGKAVGMVEGAIMALGIPLKQVTPHAWKKVVLAGTGKDKAAAIEYCRMVHPDVSLLPTPLSRVASHNLADALLIAEYGMRMERP